MTDHTPKIKKPTDEELNAAIGHAEVEGWYGLMGALLELKQRRAQDKAGVKIVEIVMDWWYYLDVSGKKVFMAQTNNRQFSPASFVDVGLAFFQRQRVVPGFLFWGAPCQEVE
jgi:hypothetical protein